MIKKEWYFMNQLKTKKMKDYFELECAVEEWAHELSYVQQLIMRTEMKL